MSPKDDLEIFQDVLDSQKEVRYRLWEALLTINSVLMAVILGVSNFISSNQTPTYIKFGYFTLFIVVLVSCALLIWNFINMHSMYSDLAAIIREGKEVSPALENRELEKSKRKNQQIILAEKFTLIAQVIIAILLVFFIFYTLFVSNTTQIQANRHIIRNRKTFYSKWR